MQRCKISLFVLLILLLSACSKPLPAEKHAYVGHWVSDDRSVNLIIHANGEVNYARNTGSTSVTLNAPLKEFAGDDFVVGIGFMTTIFKVSEAPAENEDGKWQMVVDDVRLTKQ